MLSIAKTIIDTLNVNTLHIEDRDNTMGLGSRSLTGHCC